ncbi:hypothetical protein CTI12_AA259690 [Artemisia annua]|uniref:Ist1 domain-containing protein n=1 Tax=Artemisia annua TaxID=35608 RepID=A0A2U1NJB0_ARTAN|nr:hypothetical protein CTI12_AA259690 [Artemisia annua]
MGQVESYVAQNESRNRGPNHNEKDSRVCKKYKAMLEFVFGWSEASKCKKMIKRAHSRLNELKNKRRCMVKQLRDDTEKHIKVGEFEIAFERVDQLYKDECIIAVYDLLAQFCERIFFHLSYIRRNRECPKEVMEAISSLMFASARGFPELLAIRKLFSNRYGETLETEAVNLLPGNHVNIQIIEKLSIQKVSNEVKHKLLKEISEKVVQATPLVDEFTSKQINKSNANQAASVNRTKQIAHIDLDDESTSDSSTIDIYEDIREFKSSLNKGSDQRGFVFKSSPHRIVEDIDMEKFQISTGRCSVSSVNENNMPHSGHEKTMERGMSMPCERSTTPLHDDILRKSYSLPPSSPHVHPKLPDCDVIEATFMALKRQNSLNRKSVS